MLQTLMIGHGGSSAGSNLADPSSPIPSHLFMSVTESHFNFLFTLLYVQQSLYGKQLRLSLIPCSTKTIKEKKRKQ